MKIDQGLFKFDFTDHHAILGVSLEADAKQIRKRYLKIARKLHPDSLSAATPEQKQKASEILSKMVNPAYQQLSQEKEAAEYRVVLKMRGQQLSRQKSNLQLETAPANEMLTASNVDNLYNSHLNALAEQQYEALEETLTVIGQLSELNLAYLVCKAGHTSSAEAAPPPAASASEATAGGSTSQPSAPPSPKQHRASILDSYLNRAKEFEQKQDFSRAILEVREAIQAHPKSAACHSYLASIYLKVSQPKLARIHVKRALELDPQDDLAQKLDQSLQRQAGKTSQQPSPSKGATKSDKSKGGLFGLFGGKRK